MEGLMKKWLSLFVTVALAAACGDSTGPDANLGLYVLQSIDGDPVPVRITEQPAFVIDLTSGQLQLLDGGTCALSQMYRRDDEGTITNITIDTETCTWTLNGTAISITTDDDSPVTGTLVGGTITVTPEGVVWIYVKA
jgi:hypothetical protein